MPFLFCPTTTHVDLKDRILWSSEGEMKCVGPNQTSLEVQHVEHRSKKGVAERALF